MGIIEDLRSYRICSIALFDVVLSIIAMAWICSMNDISPMIGVISAIPLGIINHYIFGINTQLNYKLGLSAKP
jgi:hypothetical protein